ncbi:outer membrane protein assembly factor BamA [Desulfobaculum bizertense]|uniref:Outer membrane protein assembly factor BamA n=1 Tax=Desulfobaculum bizertense DSM 18034 TaxID=1121442 RepID=A0A1T4WGB0_9BACT|nr:outer membrane protein assembly factor BamA [Desulfobaculum bizertense]UIJ36712.1 outer membrane protein assembly factor BamA [Desulfobaculum bizertense]SKA75691.1 Beta-barrel assembly machine subunit BamA [Desulfobaculum bizertense DSM 18034]
MNKLIERAVLACACLLMLTCVIGVGRACAQDAGAVGTQKILVLPFDVRADQDLSYLKDSLPQLLNDRLKSLGFEAISSDKMRSLIDRNNVEYLDVQTARDLSLLAGANYAVYGSFNQLGETLSLDVRLVEAFGLKPPRPLFVVKEGIINLSSAIDELGDKIKVELMRREAIADIRVEGNKFLEKDVVLMRLRSRKGDIYDPKALNEDVKRVYGLGYFKDVRVDMDESSDGVVLTFTVEERPRIQAISVLGTEELDADDVQELMSTKIGAVLNPKMLSDDLGKIKEEYRKKGFYNAKVSYNLDETGPQARLNITVDEGNKLYIEKIAIEGAEQISESELKSELALDERGIFSWITGTGVLKEDLLTRDSAAIEAYYGNHGFIDVKVGQPDVRFEDDGIYITFKVEEGTRYKVGEVTYDGDILDSVDKLKKITKLDDDSAEGEYFNRSVLHKDSQRLTEYYSNYGYAYAEADYSLNPDKEKGLVGVAFHMKKREKIYIRHVSIEGNSKTRDNVIRRELRLADGDLYSGYRLRRSGQRLGYLDYFDNADIQPVPSGEPGLMDLKVKVKEKNTGRLSAGVGYSSADGGFLTGSIEERNLFGKGYYTGFTGTIGGSDSQYKISFTNPHVYDSPWSAGGDLYLTRVDWDDYDRDTTGGRVRVGYPLGEYTTFVWNYRLEHYEVSDVSDDAATQIKEVEGKHWLSSTTVGLKRRTTDKRFDPSRGSTSSLSVEYAGGVLLGDDEFIKVVADHSQYYPLWWGTTFHIHGRAGYAFENGSDEIPVFERFYLGGINSVRGYKSRRISPVDPATGDRIGGDKMAFVNVEYIFPLMEELGLKGVVFFDAGEVWDDDESMDLDWKKSIGGGIRWYSAFGPLRLEYGYALDEVPDQGGKGKLEFSMGQFF